MGRGAGRGGDGQQWIEKQQLGLIGVTPGGGAGVVGVDVPVTYSLEVPFCAIRALESGLGLRGVWLVLK